MSFDNSCLYSVVRNVSGGSMRFTFLPPHGRRLADNEQFSIFGDIHEAVNRGARTGKRDMDALERNLNNGTLELLKTPAPILLDDTTGANKMITLDDGSIVLADPCFEVSLSP